MRYENQQIAATQWLEELIYLPEEFGNINELNRNNF